ncbi:MAG: hypothetical protein RDV41_12355 [Planctomycetota bacterium]|nr:hypothetical protein [Planctomycetota bacterium]
MAQENEPKKPAPEQPPAQPQAQPEGPKGLDVGAALKDFTGKFKTFTPGVQIVLIAAVVGIITCFLPWVSVGIAGVLSVSANGFNFTEGVLSFLAFLAAGGVQVLLMTGKFEPSRKLFTFVTLGGGGLALLMTVIVLIRGANAVGAILALLCAIAVGAGAFLEAKRQKLF